MNSRTVDALEEAHAVMVAVRTDEYFERITPDDEFEFVESRPFWEHLSAVNFTDLLRVNCAVPIGILYRRSLHEELGYFREDLPVVGGWEFNMRVAQKHDVLFIPENLAHWSKRLDAVGDQSNSVYAAADLHHLYDAKVHPDAVREHLADGGHILGKPG